MFNTRDVSPQKPQFLPPDLPAAWSEWPAHPRPFLQGGTQLTAGPGQAGWGCLRQQRADKKGARLPPPWGADCRKRVTTTWCDSENSRASNPRTARLGALVKNGNPVRHSCEASIPVTGKGMQSLSPSHVFIYGITFFKSKTYRFSHQVVSLACGTERATFTTI